MTKVLTLCQTAKFKLVSKINQILVLQIINANLTSGLPPINVVVKVKVWALVLLATLHTKNQRRTCPELVQMVNRPYVLEATIA